MSSTVTVEAGPAKASNPSCCNRPAACPDHLLARSELRVSQKQAFLSGVAGGSLQLQAVRSEDFPFLPAVMFGVAGALPATPPPAPIANAPTPGGYTCFRSIVPIHLRGAGKSCAAADGNVLRRRLFFPRRRIIGRRWPPIVRRFSEAGVSTVLCFAADSGALTASTPEATAFFDSQCYAPYELLLQASRRASNTAGTTADAFADRWYRVGGAAGTTLATRPSAFGHCGTAAGGWLSDCPLEDTPAACAAPGHFPAVPAGVVAKLVCFAVGDGQPCAEHVLAHVVNCGAFVLARLPDAPAGLRAYCTE